MGPCSARLRLCVCALSALSAVLALWATCVYNLNFNPISKFGRQSHNGVTHLRRATTREIASDHRPNLTKYAKAPKPQSRVQIPVFVRYGGDDGAPLRGHHQPKSAPVCVAVRTAEPDRYTLACDLEIPSLRCRSHCHERSELFLSLCLRLPNYKLLSAVGTAASHLSAFLHLTSLPAMIIVCRRICVGQIAKRIRSAAIAVG